MADLYREARVISSLKKMVPMVHKLLHRTVQNITLRKSLLR